MSKAVYRDDCGMRLQRLETGRVPIIMQSLLGHNKFFLKNYMKPLINLKHRNDII